MSTPVNRIEIYHGLSKIYTLDNEAINIHVKQNLNGVGTWNFSLPTKKNGDFQYYDIVPFDTVKFYLGYDTIPTNPTAMGRVCRITAPLDVGSGYIRVFEGKDQAEILERRIKKAKYWFATNMSDIVAELATELGLGIGKIQSDTNQPTFFTEDETYLDVLQKISDFWIDAGTQVKKDWYVDISNNLVWHGRPIRDTDEGVEIFTVGSDIKRYNVLRDIQAVKNHLKIYGEYNDLAHMPSADGFCESLDEWSIWTSGSLSLEDVDKKVGNHAIKGTSQLSGGQNWLDFKRTLKPNEDRIQCIKQYCNNSFGKVHFWAKCSITTILWFNILGAPGANLIAVDLTANTWKEVTLTFGEDNAGYSWIMGNNPDTFTNINEVAFAFAAQTNPFTLLVDDLYLLQGRWRGSAEDDTLDERDAVYIDDSLKSNEDCVSRAERLLYQQKEIPVRVDFETKCNTNILIGDRILLTIPAENDISDTEFDVLSVDYDYVKDAAFTRASVINAGDIRQLPSAMPNDSIKKQFDVQREVGKGLRVIK